MLASIHTLAALVFFGLRAPRAHAFWILAHGALVQDRLDPVVTPGVVSGHVHTIIGASNFKPILKPEDMMASRCTTAPVQADKSNYWAPQLYHNNPNGSFTLIPISFVNTYYLQRPDSKTKEIIAFPAGLRMLAGNPYRTAPNASDPGDKAVSFVCLDYNSNPGSVPLPPSDAFPENNCKDGLRAQVTFPSCWDGKNLDSDDHKSHMSYPTSAVDNGDCPELYPNKTITLFTEWIFDVGKFDFQQGEKNWVFSFGDELGYGFHADFVNGWDQKVLQDAIDQCTGDLFNNVQGCPPFVPSIDDALSKNCTIERVVDEEIDGPLKALPGCNPIPVKKGAQCPGYTPPQIKGQ